MYARMVQAPLQAGSSTEATNYFQESVGPALKKQSGFLNGRCMVDAATNECLMITFWESKEARQGAEEDGVLQNAIQGMKPWFAGQPVVSYYDVAVQVV